MENHGIIQQISTTRRPIVKQRCVLALRDVVSCLCIKALSNEAKETNIKTSMCASVVLPSNETGSEMVSKLKANSRWHLFNQDCTRPTAGQSSVRIRSLGLQFLRFSPTMENRPSIQSSDQKNANYKEMIRKVVHPEYIDIFFTRYLCILDAQLWELYPMVK